MYIENVENGDTFAMNHAYIYFIYMNKKGDTGPLVYPAGFVYVYIFLRWITDMGKNIRRAQYLFAVLHSATVVAASIFLLAYTHTYLQLSERGKYGCILEFFPCVYIHMHKPAYVM